MLLGIEPVIFRSLGGFLTNRPSLRRVVKFIVIVSTKLGCKPQLTLFVTSFLRTRDSAHHLAAVVFVVAVDEGCLC